VVTSFAALNESSYPWNTASTFPSKLSLIVAVL